MPVEIAFRSTGSVSDVFVSPDGTSGRLYKTGVLDISVARAFAVTPPVHLTVFSPTLFQVARDSQRCSSFCLLRAIGQTGFGPRSLDSAHQSKSEICKQRTDRTSVLTVPLRRRVIPPKFHWHRCQSIPRHSSPEDHEVRCWYPRGNVHLRRVVRRHNHVPKLR